MRIKTRSEMNHHSNVVRICQAPVSPFHFGLHPLLQQITDAPSRILIWKSAFLKRVPIHTIAFMDLRQTGITGKQIRKALAIDSFDPLPAWKRVAPYDGIARRYQTSEKNEKTAAVAVILCEEPDGISLILTRRSTRLKAHAGQISLPGGSVDASDPGLMDAALRESCEEIGLCDRSKLTSLGTLSSLYVPVSRFRIHPFVFFHSGRPPLNPAEEEVEEIYLVSLMELYNPSSFGFTERLISGDTRRVPCYRSGDLEIWGATAAVLSELEMRIKTATASDPLL